VFLVRLSIYFNPFSNEMVDHKSNESSNGEAAGSPWCIRDLLSFVQKTYQERDVADATPRYPIILCSKLVGDMPGRRGTRLA
jgi:hypothetical protein